VRVAALYDIHGNLPALEAVLADPLFAETDVVLVGGDVVAGPQPREVLELLLGLGDRVHFIRGNGDRWVAGANERDIPESLTAEVRWCAERLDARQLAEVYAWPLTTVLPVDGVGDVLFCHATPRSDMELVTPWTPIDEVMETLVAVAQETVVCGHIHVSYERAVGRKSLVNPGSVGRPNQRPLAAYWARLGARPSHSEFVRTDYDLERSIAAIRAAGYPSDDLATALREPPRAAETIAHFEALRGA
jgi:predicted phosphodiesterase